MTNFTATFNDKLSRLALDKIHAKPKRWDQTIFHYRKAHCGTAHCYMGWCDVISGNWDGDKRGVSQKTIDLMGLKDYEYAEFVDPDNSLARLEALHTFHVTGIFGINGYDTDGFDRDGLDIDKIFDRYGYNREGYNREGYDNEEYDRDGFDRDGFDRDGYDYEGYDEDGYDDEDYDGEGYDRYNLNREGFDRYGYDEDGFDKKGLDEYGYNVDGYNVDGYDRNGLFDTDL